MKNILVAEDETAIREFVVINLERAGYNVTEADCGEAALETYEQKGGDFDIAILDIILNSSHHGWCHKGSHHTQILGDRI